MSVTDPAVSGDGYDPVFSANYERLKEQSRAKITLHYHLSLATAACLPVAADVDLVRHHIANVVIAFERLDKLS